MGKFTLPLFLPIPPYSGIAELLFLSLKNILSLIVFNIPLIGSNFENPLYPPTAGGTISARFEVIGFEGITKPFN